MFINAYGAINEKKDYVDSLNVFPVPDGDTGINMTLTMQSVIKEVESITSNEVVAISAAVSRGGLKGARGNSGVILSQILKGMMAEMSRPFESQKKAGQMSEVTTRDFARCVENAAKVAYSAVTEPKEGTILTVIRIMGEEAKKIAKIEPDFIKFLQKLIEVGEQILAQTPEMLPVLKKAGVVDSGGRGLLIIFGGFLSALDGSVEVNLNFENDGKPVFGDGADGDEIESDIEFAYCTEFNISNMHKSTTMASINTLQDRLLKMGDSVVCVGDLEMVKVHVHTNTPGEAVTQALQLGEIINLKIDNMLQQMREMRATKNIEDKEQGIVVVSAGDGIAQVFKDLGVDVIIKGGQTMNPSAEDIAKAAERVYAKTVFVFPNNKNIILAAKHAQDLCKKELIVIPTSSVNEGIAACVAFDDSASIEENRQAFNEAAANVKSASVTYAVRTTRFDRFSVKEGEVLGMDNKTIIAKGASVSDVTVRVIDKLVTKDTSSVTLFYGELIKEKDANALHDKLLAKYPGIDFNMVDGGQPVYYYLVSVE